MVVSQNPMNGKPRRKRLGADLDQVFRAFDPSYEDAVRLASRSMSEANIRHVLIGGLAVGAYGYIRGTKDIDFLVGEEAFNVHGGGIVTHHPAVPIFAKGLAVDSLTPSFEGDEKFLEAILNDPPIVDGIPLISVEALIYLKLKAGRRRDQEDVFELLRSGIDSRGVRSYLEANAPELLPRLDRIFEWLEEE
jgi:hypothetical protein